jgi:hypothetical protein
MDVKFAFALGQEVVLENGIKGRVDGVAVYENSKSNRIGVLYSDNTGRISTVWLDEEKVKAASA